MSTMTREEWKWAATRGFSEREAWGDPYRMDRNLIVGLIEWRDRIRKDFPGAQVIIHCGYQERVSGGEHPKGRAVDLHVTRCPLVDAFLLAERVGRFGGIGIYPSWNSPGLHLDTGQAGRRWSKLKGETGYTALNSRAIREALNV